MQLTGPLFLFLFFPLSLPLLPLCPARYRQHVLCGLSVAWYVLANLSSPLAILQVAAVLAAVMLLSALPDGEYSKLRCAAGILIPFGTLVAARVAAEYGPSSYPYPFGLTFIALGAISLAVDRYRGDAPDRDSPWAVAGYLLFFPTLTMGPVLRYKQYLYMMEHSEINLERFSSGARLYMLGFIKRIAIAAVLLRALEDLLSYAPFYMSFFSLFLAILLAYFLLYFFLSGNTDMARGLVAMYGLQPPRGQDKLLSCTTPGRMLEGMLISYSRYLEDYVVRPIRHRISGVGGKLLSVLAVFVLTVLFYRLRPELLLIGLPILLVSCLTVRLGKWRPLFRHAYLRLPCMLLSSLLVAVLALGIVMEEPMQLFAYFADAWRSSGTYSFYYVYSALADGPYIAALALALLVCIPLAHFGPVLARRMSRRMHAAFLAVSTVLLCLGFVVTLIHFMPQFPQYADRVSKILFL